MGAKNSHVMAMVEKYPRGTKLSFIQSKDPEHAHIPLGTRGEVQAVSEEGEIYVKWKGFGIKAMELGKDDFCIDRKRNHIKKESSFER